MRGPFGGSFTLRLTNLALLHIEWLFVASIVCMLTAIGLLPLKVSNRSALGSYSPSIYSSNVCIFSSVKQNIM